MIMEILPNFEILTDISGEKLVWFELKKNPKEWSIMFCVKYVKVNHNFHISST